MYEQYVCMINVHNVQLCRKCIENVQIMCQKSKPETPQKMSRFNIWYVFYVSIRFLYNYTFTVRFLDGLFHRQGMKSIIQSNQRYFSSKYIGISKFCSYLFSYAIFFQSKSIIDFKFHVFSSSWVKILMPSNVYFVYIYARFYYYPW